jgi:putative nucleotidyltransferase with HDIG domain
LLQWFGLAGATSTTAPARDNGERASRTATPARENGERAAIDEETSFGDLLQDGDAPRSGPVNRPATGPGKPAESSGKNTRAPGSRTGETSGKNARAPIPEKPWQPAKPEFNDNERRRVMACNEDAIQSLASTITTTLLASIDKIPPFPVIASKLVQALEGTDVRTDVVERLITQDAVIAARILSTANSSFYSPPTTIETLPHAIRVIGLQEVAQIAVSVAASAVFDVEERIAHESVSQQQQQAWTHSLATARGTAWLALQLNLDVQRAYVAGLLHDIGKPVALRGLGLAIIGGRLGAPPPSPLVYAAIEECHVDVGGIVADAWELAPHLAEVIATHHDDAPGSPLTRMVALVAAVDELRTNPAHRNGLLLQVQSLARDLQVTSRQLVELEFELKKASSLSARA